MSPPKLVYTDRDCCARGAIASFPLNGMTCVRLDIRHFMTRIAIAFTTESHPSCATLTGRMSKSIFEWSVEHFSNLKTARARKLGLDVITRKEMTFYRRKKPVVRIKRQCCFSSCNKRFAVQKPTNKKNTHQRTKKN